MWFERNQLGAPPQLAPVEVEHMIAEGEFYFRFPRGQRRRIIERTSGINQRARKVSKQSLNGDLASSSELGLGDLIGPANLLRQRVGLLQSLDHAVAQRVAVGDQHRCLQMGKV